MIGTRPPTQKQIGKILKAYTDRKDEVDLFRQQVAAFFQTSQFSTSPLPLIHSVKSRLKEPAHLADKIRRKWAEKRITPTSLFKEINDLAGVRVLHLYTNQFSEIHSAIRSHISAGYWVLAEKPVAYSWDPENTAYFRGLGLISKTRESYYTSIHYIVKPHARSDVSCEIQVRTLFEEIWGEIDHAINYPHESKIVACREQLRVLAKLTSTGTRLADAIFKISQAG